MQTETLNFNPPRNVLVPLQPLPQTVMATLEHSGIPTSLPNLITDIPPDFGWMSQIQNYVGSFEYKTISEPQTMLHMRNAHVEKEISGGNPERAIATWTTFPLLCSKWWNGIIGYKLLAIKPPRVTGKILVRYSYDPWEDFENDKRRRMIAKEWDLGQSSECEFDVVGMNTIQARPTWLPMIDEVFKKNEMVFSRQCLGEQEWHFGSLRIEAAQRLQVGSIFPDSIRILIFQVYKNSEFYMPTDPRGHTNHFLYTGTSKVSIPLAKNNE